MILSSELSSCKSHGNSHTHTHKSQGTEDTHTKPKLINRVGSANEEEEVQRRIKGTNKHVGVISYGGYELTHLERS